MPLPDNHLVGFAAVDEVRSARQLRGQRCSVEVHASRLPVVTRVTRDVDEYRNNVGGVEIEIVRGGPDLRPSTARRVEGEGIVVTAVAPGCRTISHTRLPADRMSSAYVLEGAPGTRWCGEFEVTAGMSVVHLPDAEHTAVNEPGTRFAFAVADTDAVQERAELLEIPTQNRGRGDVDVSVTHGALGGTAAYLTHLATAPIESVPARLLDDLLTAITVSLAGPRADRRLEAPSCVDSRKVVGDCIEFAGAIGREPSISEMCLAAKVSDRRLRQAFHDTLGVSPKNFFRKWILCRAHDLLLEAQPGDASVTRIATDLGITHFGRFSAQYRDLHDELPSKTLHRSAVSRRAPETDRTSEHVPTAVAVA